MMLGDEKMLAFVILNYNTWEETIKCVDSIFKTCRRDFKIYIVDNGSKNNSYEKLFEIYADNDKIDLIKSTNDGYAIGNNIGMRQAINDGFEYITVVNNDVIFLENSIDEMYTFLSNSPDKVGVVAPYILSPEGNLQNEPTLKPVSKKDYFLYNTRIQRLVGSKKLMEFQNQLILKKDSIHDEPLLIHKFSGCCFMAKSKMLKEVNFFDEQTFLYYEEDILCMKMKEKGFKAYFLPTAKIVHYHGLTTGKENLFVDTEMLKSEMYFLSKYYDMSIPGLFLIYLDRAITPLISKFKNKYNVPMKEYSRFLKNTFNHFIKVQKSKGK